MSKRPGENGYLADSGVQLHYVSDIDGLMAFKRWAGERRSVLCVDTETTGLRPDVDRVRLIQFGDTREGWAIPWDGWWGGAIEVLSAYEGELGLHNSKFDARSIRSTLKRSGVDFAWPWHRTHDTMSMAHLLNPLRPKGLKPLGARLVDPQAIAGQKRLDNGMKENGWTWATVPTDYPPYWVYGAMDPVLTAHILEYHLPKIKELYSYPYELEMGTTNIVAGMEEIGMRVDPAYLQMKRSELLDFTTRSRAWLWDEYHLDNPTPMKLIKFFQHHGVPLLPKKTKGGTQAMDKEVLDVIDHPVGQVVRHIRKAEKLVGTYIDNLLRLRDEEDTVHANIWTMGTRTARMTIEDPALQTLPKKDTTIRSAFIPREGRSLISFDADQIEARLMAHFSGSQAMADAFTGPGDFFLSVASQIFGETITDKSDPRRQVTKGTVYGKIYGGGEETLAHVAGVSRAQMRQVLAGFDRSFPEVTALMATLNRLASTRQRDEGESYVYTPTGRRLVADEGKEYTMTNYLIQGHAAEILKQNVNKLHAALPDEVDILMLVHDEILMEAPTEMVPELMPLIKETLDDHDGYNVPITWGGESSEKSWGDLVEKS